MKINISKIIIKDRIRKVKDIEYINDLSKSISEVGLLHNIVINEDFELVAGAHRLEAIKKLGWEEVEVNIIDNSIKNQLSEIDENLIRKKLNPIEVSEHLERRKEIYEVLYPETKKSNIVIKNLQNNTDNSLVQTFTSSTSELLGESQRYIQLKTAISKNIKNEQLKEELKSIKDLTISNANRISKLEKKEQDNFLKEIIKLKSKKEQLNNLNILELGRDKNLQKIRVESSDSIKEKILNQSFKIAKMKPTDNFEKELKLLKKLVLTYENI